MNTPLSIIIPTLDEEQQLPGLLGDLTGLRVDHEVIVVDGGSADATAEIARSSGSRLLTAAPSRGGQLRAGAKAARGEVLCFLHADVRLRSGAIGAIGGLVGSMPRGAFAFRLKIDAPGLTYRVMERGANARSRWLRLPYGDQGLIVRAADYFAVGGHPIEPLMEDVTIVRALRGVAPVHLLDAEVHVSPRRWERDGPWRRWSRNQLLLLRYLAGASPSRLAAAYPPEPRRHE